MADVPDNQRVETVLQTHFNEGFANRAVALTPQLHRQKRTPNGLVHFEKENSSFFGVKVVHAHSVEELPQLLWSKRDEFILDFGIHLVGHFSIRLDAEGVNIDAPCRLRFTFGESPFDVTEDMSRVDTWISTSWLPDELINVDWMPETVHLSRRYSFRYVRIQIVDTSPKYKVKFSNCAVESISSIAPSRALEILDYHDDLLQSIDEISVFTLRDCMQTVFEDGPRRDRRLWIGDLRLQALTSYHTLKDYDLVKRCLFLFAALPREDDSLPACLFEKPRLVPATDYIVDYDALFGVIVHDYVVASGDQETGRLLWPTIMGSLKGALSHVDSAGRFDSSSQKTWKFIDWAENLDTSASMHGLLLYALKSVQTLGELLELPFPHERQITAMSAAAQHFLDTDTSLFVSGPNMQISLASASWLTMSGAFHPNVCRKALLGALSHPACVRPLTPYLYHHITDALCTAGLPAEAVDLIKRYWGGMVKAGADTFWECYDEDNARRSPYGDVRNNSFCHAWSCTPSYLLRVQLRDFLGANVKEIITMGELDQRYISRNLH